jgi:hypothetical protein
MNICGSCNVCCNGSLIGEAYGNKFGEGTPCSFLECDKCTIYDDRPEVCRNYECAYTQDIIPNLERPDLSGILTSVKTKIDGQQFLESIIVGPHNQHQVKLIDEFAKSYNTKHTIINNTQPDVDCLSEVIETLKRVGEGSAIKSLLDTFSKYISSCEQADILAKHYYEQKFYNDSVEVSKIALSLSPSEESSVTTRTNYIMSLLHANMPEEALKQISIQEQYLPRNVRLLLDKSFAKFLNNEKVESELLLRNSLERFDLSDIEKTKIKFNLGTHHLYKDEFQTGLKLFLYEGSTLNSWNIDGIFTRDTFNEKYKHKIKKWEGETVSDANILCYAEAGIGDEIINVRFMDEIKKRGMNPIWMNDMNTRNDLVEIFRENGYEVITSLEETDQYDNLYHCHTMTIPVLMGLEYEDLWKGTYLKANPDYVDKWKDKTKTNKKLKVGIRWRGVPDYDQDLHRSVLLKDIYESVKHLDAEFYSLQIDNYDEIDDFPGLIDLHDDLENWHDTFGLIENLDFVISSCTSVAHASASTGKKTFVFVPITAYYVWSHSMEQSPWYGDNVTILRQNKPRVWDEPCKKLKDTLLLDYK